MSDRQRPSNPGDPATRVGGDPKSTEVGSVFVSNYPPYSAWSSDHLPAVEQVLETPPDPRSPLGLYVHIPFCRRRCKFCYFKVYTDKNAAQVDAYCRALLAEFALYAGRPALRERPLRFVYFGGGTPSFVSARHLSRLFSGLRSTLSWDKVDEVTFECEPGTLTRPKLETLQRLGVTRLSLGVENFDDEILRENGRAHVSKEIWRVLPWIRAIGFRQLNIDLIAGMVGERWETWKTTVARTIEAAPDSVTIYQLELPFNTVYSGTVLSGETIPVADWETKRAWHDYAFRELEQAGYAVSSGYTMLRRGSGARFAYRDALWRGSDLLGIGVSSFSHLHGVHFQNVSGWQPYLDRVEARELPLDRAFPTGEQDRLIREMILQMKLGRLERRYFRDKFGVDVVERFGDAFERLERRAMLQVGDEEVRLTREGLLRVDLLLPEFYDPRYRGARYT